MAVTVVDDALSRNVNQYRIYREAMYGNSRRIVVRAGRKFGKTFVAVRIARDWALSTGGVVLIGAPQYPYLRDETIPELAKAVPPELLRGRGWGEAFSRSEYRLQLVRGEIILRSMENADAVRPLSVDGLIAEEFSLWSRYAWQECVKPTLMAKNARAVFIFTPKGRNQACEEWKNVTDGIEGYTGFHFTSWDGVLPAESINSEVRGLPDAIVRQEFYAEFLDDLGGVFQHVDDCIAGDFMPPQPGYSYVMGVDLGKTQDATVVTVMQHDGYVVHVERITQLDWVTQRNLIKSIADRYSARIILDTTGVGDPVYDELVASGCRVTGYRFTAESKRVLIEKLLIAMANKKIFFPYHPMLVDELKLFQAKSLPGGGVQYSAPAGYHDDHVISLALAVAGLGGAVTRQPATIPRQREVV